MVTEKKKRKGVKPRRITNASELFDAPKKKSNGGRPTKYNEELAKKICYEISTSIYGLKTICAQNADFPDPSNIFAWLVRYPVFQEMYDRAREHQGNVMADEILNVSYDDSRDDVISERGISCNTEWVSRSRLKADSLKWLLTKLQPRKYGDKTFTDNVHTITPFEDYVKLKKDKNDK